MFAINLQLHLNSPLVQTPSFCSSIGFRCVKCQDTNRHICRAASQDFSYVISLSIPSYFKFFLQGLDYKGPVPDPESFEPLEEPPNPGDIYLKNIEEFDKLNKAFVEEAERTRRPVDPKDLL